MQRLRSWIKKRKWNDWTLFLIVLIFLIMKAPSFLDQYKQQGVQITPIIVDEKIFPALGIKSVLVFWASWCGPCTIELNRIQSALDKKEISSKNIYAVNMGESPGVIKKVMQERKYTIPIIFDDQGALARLLNVQVTPTVVLINEPGKIAWISSGLSPTLIYRIKFFLED